MELNSIFLSDKTMRDVLDGAVIVHSQSTILRSVKYLSDCIVPWLSLRTDLHSVGIN